ncbi:protein kinase [bacterium]|nr:protein kinase [bacterium]
MICPNCKTENPNSNWYCLACGENLRPTSHIAVTASGTSATHTGPDGTRVPRGRRPKATAEKAGSTGGGKLFAGRYADLERIGDGAMATVYKARDSVLDQTVALKVLHPSLASNPDYLTRFHREIALARTITHPNVYRIFDLGQADQTQFISMEYIEGRELKKEIQAGTIDLETGLSIVRQIAAALAEAHTLGVVHRDLKPQNIMLEKRTGRCVVMDFGIATGENLSALTVSGTFLGTPEYISPEQAQGLKLDLRTDIYSLGVIMYEIFTGRLPFGPGKPLSVALAHVKETPEPPRRVAPQIGAALEGVILKAMHREPSGRYQSAAELSAALDRLLQDRAGPEESKPTAQAPTSPQPAGGSLQNPYLSRKMLRDSRSFFGRRREISTIYGRIGASRPQSVSIVGERRIGKSSLLHYINDPENRRAWLRDHEHYTFIFMDFQEKRSVPLSGFFASLFENLSLETGISLDELPQPDYNGFKKVCEEFDRRNRKLVLLFDEFESITKNKNFDPEFFSFLRSAANNYNVAYITSSVKNLQELCYNREISDSPFFNIFSNLNLSAFSEEEALEFVSQPSRAAGHPLEEHFETVVDLAGYFPFFMSIACSVLFEFDFSRAMPSKTVFENVEDRFLEEAGMHFQFILRSLGPDEIETCRKIMSGESLGDLDRYSARNLLKRGYLLESGDPPELRLFSRVLERMIRESLLRRNQG